MFVTIVEGAIEALRQGDLRSAWKDKTAILPPVSRVVPLASRNWHVADRHGMGVKGSCDGDASIGRAACRFAHVRTSRVQASVSMWTVEDRVSAT
jgi:hypothetical protein